MTTAAPQGAQRTAGRLRPYPRYKDSGVEWLGEIPEDWEVKRVKAILVRNDGGVWGEDFDDDGVIVLRSTEQTVDGEWNIVEPAKRRLTPTEYASCRLREGDLVVTKSSGSSLHIGKTSIVTKEIEELNCCHSNFMQRLRVKDDALPRFVWYGLNGELGRKQFAYYSSTTTGLANLNGAIIGNVGIAVPPPNEQRAIAAFLDRETARIDALIEKKERQIELLQEKRAAVISHAVTKGLDRNVKMKDSGVEWLGEIPEHWDTCPLKHTASFINGAAFKPSDWQDDGIPIIRIENLNGGDEFNYYDGEVAKRYHVSKGDLLFGWSGNRGTSFGPFLWWRDGLHYLNQHIFKITQYKCDKMWLYWMLTGVTFYVEKQAHGIIGLVHITKGDLGAIKIPVLSLEEQREIADHIYRETARIDALTERIRKSIDLLREYRTALISAAVTGKIDVKEEAVA